MTRPLIGISLDAEEPGGYSRSPWYALRQNYCDAVASAGGLPFCLPHRPELAEDYLAAIDGLVISGGAFDVDPALFGATGRHAAVRTKDRRTRFEMAMVRGALSRDLPILGICGGEQVLAVALGGSLIQHIPDEVTDGVAHEQSNPPHQPGHEVTVVAGTLLSAIALGLPRLAVNSTHHQAVKTVPAGIKVNALADDGVIEGIEDPARRFCLGVQWHPEYGINPTDTAIFTAFIGASRT